MQISGPHHIGKIVCIEFEADKTMVIIQHGATFDV